MGVQALWKKMDKTNELDQMEYVNVDIELISETKKISPEKSYRTCHCFISALLCGSVLLMCIQIGILYFHVLDVLESKGPSEHLKKPTMLSKENGETSLNPMNSSLESLKMLVSLMASERLSQKLLNDKTKMPSVIQRFLSAKYKTDHSRVLLTKAEPYDIAFGNFTANQVSIQIPKKGFYEVSTIATMKITPNITTATHAVFRESGNTTLIIMKRSYSVHADVMAFQQSVLKDTFLLNHGDKLSVFVSRVYGVYEKTTPISIRLIGYGS